MYVTKTRDIILMPKYLFIKAILVFLLISCGILKQCLQKILESRLPKLFPFLHESIEQFCILCSSFVYNLQ